MFYDFDCAGGRRVSIGQPSNVGRERHSCIRYASRSKKHTVGATHIRAERTLHLMIRSLLSGSGLGGNIPERLELFVSLDVGGRHRRGT